MDEVAKKRQAGIKRWFKDWYNVLLVLIIIFSFSIHLYYFIHTTQQPLWWDEAEYMAAAKHWAFQVPYNIAPQRPPLFQYASSLIFMAGLNELSVKFLLVLIPAVLLPLFVYLLGKEMYDKKIGLIAAFLTSVSWTYLFWSARIQPDFMSMCFQVLSIFFMWKYWKNNKTSFVIFSGIFAALGVLFKISGLLVPLIFMVFIFVKDRFSAFKNKHYYYFTLAFILTFSPYFLWAYHTFNTPIAIFTSGYSNAVSTPTPYGWFNFKYFYYMTDYYSLGYSVVFFILLMLGIILSLKFLLYADLLIKEKKKAFDPDIFTLLAIIIISAFYIFYMKYTEDRWVFLWLPFFFFFIGKALVFLYDFLKKYSKAVAIVVVLGLLLVGAYGQLKDVNALINAKKDTYSQVRDAALWMKKNSEKNDSIATVSNPQTTFYAERRVYSFSGMNESQFVNLLMQNKPKYLEVSVFETHPDWIYSWLQNNQGMLTVVQAYFDQNNQPLLVVYQIKYPAIQPIS